MFAWLLFIGELCTCLGKLWSLQILSLPSFSEVFTISLPFSSAVCAMYLEEGAIVNAFPLEKTYLPASVVEFSTSGELPPSDAFLANLQRASFKCLRFVFCSPVRRLGSPCQVLWELWLGFLFQSCAFIDQFEKCHLPNHVFCYICMYSGHLLCPSSHFCILCANWLS